MVISTFRQRQHQQYRKYRAILILTNSLTASERAVIENSLQNIERMSTPELRRRGKELKSDLNQMINYYGVIGSLEELEEPLQVASPDDRFTHWRWKYILKHHLCQLFRHYEKALPVFAKLPQHARIGIDVNAIRDTKDTVEIFQLEASLFEDMAALWNVALTSSSKSKQLKTISLEVKLETKHTAALIRAAAKAAFNLIEGYLNGLAFDILLTQNISREDTNKLSEWDWKRNRSMPLSLRDKILQYPKIATGLTHPPIQESAIPAMQVVLDLEKRVRHALIHPKPMISPRDLSELREEVFLQLSIEDVATTCDAVIDLIYAIAETVGDAYGDVSLWLRKRGTDGGFPEEVFH